MANEIPDKDNDENYVIKMREGEGFFNIVIKLAKGTEMCPV